MLQELAQNGFVEPESGSRPPVQQSVHQVLQHLINTLEKVHSHEMSSVQKLLTQLHNGHCQQIAKQDQQHSQEVQLLRNQLLQETQAHEKTKQQLAQQAAANAQELAQAQLMLEKRTADWSKCCKTLGNLAKCLEEHQE